jgi:hypothetical protein
MILNSRTGQNMVIVVNAVPLIVTEFYDCGLKYPKFEKCSDCFK